MIDPESMQATQSHVMMKLPIKTIQNTHKLTIKIHGGNIPMTILARLLLDHSSQGIFDWTHQMYDLQVNLYVGGIYPGDPAFA